MYKPIPLTNGVNILLNDMHKKRNETHKKAKHLLQRHKTKPTTQKTTPETNQFILVPGKNALILKEKNLLNNAQKTVSIITSKQRFSQKLYSLNEELKKAITKGTKIRILMEKTNTQQNQTLTNTLTKTTKDKTNFEIRYITTPSPVILCLFDNKDVLLITTANAGLPESPALWSNNPSLTELAHNYFEILWITAIETNTPNPTTP